MKSKTATKQDARNWNFSAVDESELVACCFWEYARESNALRDAVNIVKTFLANQGKPTPETPERQAFREAAECAFGLLLQTGLPLLFWTGHPFPETQWQRIDKTKRSERAKFYPDKFADAVKFPAFQVTGDLSISSRLHDAAREAHNACMAIYQRLSEIESGADADNAANLDEADKLRKKLFVSPMIIQGLNGVDSFISQINWKMFSKPQIKACFNKWVDSYDSPQAKPSGRGRGNTVLDWRARLDRLGLLRLRREYTFEEAKPFLKKLYPPIISAQSKPPRKFDDAGECNREAVRADEDFRYLFPFLAETLDCHLMD